MKYWIINSFGVRTNVIYLDIFCSSLKLRALELRKMYLQFVCGEISSLWRLRNSRHVLWFCGVTMPKISAGGQQGVLEVASALRCTRVKQDIFLQRKRIHFAVLLSGELNILPSVTFYISCGDSRRWLQIIFESFRYPGKAKVLTDKKGWRCLFLQPFRFVTCWCEELECSCSLLRE